MWLSRAAVKVAALGCQHRPGYKRKDSLSIATPTCSPIVLVPPATCCSKLQLRCVDTACHLLFYHATPLRWCPARRVQFLAVTALCSHSATTYVLESTGSTRLLRALQVRTAKTARAVLGSAVTVLCSQSATTYVHVSYTQNQQVCCWCLPVAVCCCDILLVAVYRDKLDAWTAYMQQNYPHLLQPQNKGTAQRQMVDASMDAFAALERQLEQQQEQQRRQQQQSQQQQQPGQQMDDD
jgi:hypothetical protein